MSTVLVTGVGGAGGTATVKSLRENTSHTVVGVDSNPNATGFFFVDEWSTVSLARETTWKEEMSDLIDQYDIDVVVPLVDEELSQIPALQDKMTNEVPFIAPRPEVVKTALDKYRTYRRLSSCGVPVPNTFLASERDSCQFEYPIVIKPRTGRGSRGVERVETRADLERYIKRSDKAPKELILQEYIEGTEYTTSVVTTVDNRLLAIVPKEVLEKKGNTTRGVTREEPSIVDTCRQIYKELGPGGPINVQQIIDERTGNPYTIEINPRFSSTACLTVAAGVNELDLLIRDALGQSVEKPNSFQPNTHLVRYTGHLLLDGDSVDDSLLYL